MDIYLASFLQGITEFFPVSSSFHLSLLQRFYHIDIQSLDVWLHLATLFSVCIFFRYRIFEIAKNFLFTHNKKDGWVIIIATLPAVFVGFFIKKMGIVPYLKTMAISSIFFGCLLGISDFLPEKKNSIGYKEGLIIGIAQVFSFIPGASRLGCTLTMGRILGIQKKEAVSFSFLLSIPTVSGAIVLNLKDFSWNQTSFFILLTTSIIGYLSLTLFMRYLTFFRLWAFALYRIILGVLILFFIA